MEIEVNGKKVVLRDKLGAKANFDLMPMFEEIGRRAQKADGGLSIADLKYEELRDLILRYVASWEFEGDPTDKRVYDDMDLISEFMELGKFCMTLFGGARQEQAEREAAQDTKN